MRAGPAPAHALCSARGAEIPRAVCRLSPSPLQAFHRKPVVWGERGRAVQQAGGENDSPTAAGLLRPQCALGQTRRSDPRTRQAL